MISVLLLMTTLGAENPFDPGRGYQKIVDNKGHGPVVVTDGGALTVTCPDGTCSGGGGGGSSTITVDGGVLGSVTWIDGGYINATILGTPTIQGTVSVSNFPAQYPGMVSIDGGSAAGTLGVNVNNTVGVTQSTSPWVVSGATNIGTSTATTPRVSVASDSSIVLNGGTLATITGSVVLPTGASTSANQTTLGNQTSKINDGTNTAAVKAASTAAIATDPALVVTLSPNNGVGVTQTTSPWVISGAVNVSQIGGSSIATGGTGIQKVAITGNASATIDAVNNGTVAPNVVQDGAEVISAGSNPTAASSATARRILATTEGVLITQEGGSNRFSCIVNAATVTTQCQAAPAAGLRAYVTSVGMSNQAATAIQLDVVYGTGAACVTGTTALTHKIQFGTAATTTSPQEYSQSFPTPLVPVAANAICVRPSAATAFGATITGYIAP